MNVDYEHFRQNKTTTNNLLLSSTTSFAAATQIFATYMNSSKMQDHAQ